MNDKKDKRNTEEDIPLEECPFCHSRAEYKEYGAITTRSAYYTVRCTQCSAMLAKHFRTKREAAYAWNRSKPPKPQIYYRFGQ